MSNGSRWVLALLSVGLLTVASCPSGRKKAPAKKAELVSIEESIRKGIAFLRANQWESGGWGKRQADVGITGLVLDAIAKAPPDIRKENEDLLESGARYLLANRRDDGSIVNEDKMLANYRTSIAARALIAIDKEKYKDVIAAAVKYTKGIQGADESDPARFGSMGYGMSDPSKGDIINTAEALELLAKAGVKKDDEAWKRALVFLARTQNLDEGDELAKLGVRTTNDGGAIYRGVRGVEGASKAGTIKLADGTVVPRSYGGATYCLLKSLLFAGLKKDHPRVQAAYEWVCEHYTVEEHPELGKQGLFYFYYTMARTLELWGTPTIKKGATSHNWAKELSAEIISMQKEDGSWINEKDRWWESDPSLVTAYGVLVLNTCHPMLAK